LSNSAYQFCFEFNVMRGKFLEWWFCRVYKVCNLQSSTFVLWL